MLLCNTLFDVDTILSELDTPHPSDISALEILQRKLKTHYFPNCGNNQEILALLEEPAFRDFPRLKYVLTKIFSGHKKFQIPEGLRDWAPPADKFRKINLKYGYFEEDLSSLFQKLAIACRKMTVLIEQTEAEGVDDEMAYKLMALFYDPSKSQDANFVHISQQFNKLFKTRKDKSIKTPYHDAFITDLVYFPKFRDVINLPGWQEFLKSAGFKALSIFSQYAEQVEPFTTIQEAQEYILNQIYPRANEHPRLAKLCKSMLISNHGFEAGLEQVLSGWPKKESDNLPIVDIADDSGRFFWVKLPPQDMRAMYLGNLIPGCCQFIDGHSQQCVKDGICLADNGFYVLLKAKKKPHSPRIQQEEINSQDYDIVALSYAWRSTNGNLCLDSIEWHEARVTIQVIKDLMSKFSAQVFAKYPEIKHINVGVGGQTPDSLYPPCIIPETIKQGYFYGDALNQYRIASAIQPIHLNALQAHFTLKLKTLTNVIMGMIFFINLFLNIFTIDELIDASENLFQRYPKSFQDTLLYLAPYFDDIDNILESLTRINPQVIDTLPMFIQSINLPPKLCVEDFRIISFQDYKEMDAFSKSSISSICKLFNSPTETELLQWLPTIPDADLSYISLVKTNYSQELQMQIFQRLSLSQQKQIIQQSDQEHMSFLQKNLQHPEMIKLILEVNPSIEERLDTLIKKNMFGHSLLNSIARYPESLKMIITLFPSEKILLALKSESTLLIAAENPDCLRVLITLLPNEKLIEALTEQYGYNESALATAAKNPECLKMIVALYSSNEKCLQALKEQLSRVNTALNNAAANPECLKMIYALCSSNEVFIATLKARNNIDFPALYDAFSNPECLKIILDLYPSKQECFEALKEKDKIDIRAFYHTANNPECLKMLFELYPNDEERFKILSEEDPSKIRLIFIKASQNMECLKLILQIYPSPYQLLKALKEQNSFDNDILHFIISTPEAFNVLNELLPLEISLVLQTYQKEPGVLEYAFSIEQFMLNMKRLADSKAICAFVHALIENKDIEKAKQSLFKASATSSLFIIDNNEAIQNCIDELHSFWQDRIPPSRHSPQSIKY